MQKSGNAYFTGALGVAGSRVLTILAGIISLWLLTRILPTEWFAGYSVAMSVVVLSGYTVGFGIERSLLTRIGELKPDPTKLVGTRMMRKVFATTAISSVLAALVAVGFSTTGDTPRHVFLALLSPAIPGFALSLVLVTWFQANHHVGISQITQGMNDGIRCLMIGVAFLFGFGVLGVAAAAIIGAIAPLVFLAFRARGRTEPEPSEFFLSDVVTGMQFLLGRMSKMGLNQLGIIAMGVLGTATGTAQLAVAVRFAILIESGQSMFAPTFAPRVRRHLATDDLKMAAREYHVSRVLGFTAALSAAIGFLVIGRPVLSQFGEFGVGYAAFLILVAAYLMIVGVGLHATFMSMSDYLGKATTNRLASVVVFVLGLWILVPPYDATGAAIAFFLAAALHEVVGVYLLKRYLKIQAFSALEAALLAAACVVLGLTAFGMITTVVSFALLVAILAISTFVERALFLHIAGDVLRIVKRHA